MCVGQQMMTGVGAYSREGCSMREMVEGEGERECDLCVVTASAKASLRCFCSCGWIVVLWMDPR